MTVDGAIREALADWGDHPCFLDPHAGAAPTRADVWAQQIRETAAELRFWGIRPRHLVPLFLTNSVQFVTVLAALLEIRAVPVLAKMEYRRLELEEIFRNAEPQGVICEESHLGVLRPYLDGRMTVLTRGPSGLTAVQSGEGSPAPDGLPDDAASINYTYRGYGYPLGAMVSHAQYLHGARVLQEGLQGRPGDRMLFMLPMAHIFTLVGCVLVPLLSRMTGVVCSTLHPRRLFECIRELGVDHVTSVPEAFEVLARSKDQHVDVSCLKTFVSGGSLLTEARWAAIRSTFSIDLLHGYGLTEFTPISRNVRGRSRGGTVGPVCDGVQCRVHGAGPDGEGEIQIQAPSVGCTYYRRPAESAEAVLDGWFRTGDLGRFDDGHLVFCREIKATRKVNGNIVDLAELERALRSDPEVGEAELLWKEGVLSARIGLRRGAGGEARLRSLRLSLRELIAGYKLPRHIALL